MALYSAVLLLMALASTAVAAFAGGAVLVNAVALARLQAGSGRWAWLRCLVRERIRTGRVTLMRRMQRNARVRVALGRMERRQRTRELRTCMPEALQSMCVTLDAGGSVNKALAQAADSCGEPLAAELRQVEWDLRAGHSFDESMRRLRERTGGTEFAYLAVAMEVQHRCGGSLGKVLRSVMGLIQQVAAMETELETKTSQARLSARVVAIMPLVLLAVLSLLSPGYLSAFFASSAGVLLLMVAVILELAGVVLVRKALHVDLYGARSAP